MNRTFAAKAEPKPQRDGPQSGRAPRRARDGVRGAAAGQPRFLQAAPGSVQPKLAVNVPGDAYEQEAERVAAEVRSGATVPTTGTVARPAAVQRTSAPAPTAAATQPQLPPITARTADTIASPGLGEPLAPDVRRRVEPHLGMDLGGVRVHRGGAAAQATRQLQARAFTHGTNIFLASGERHDDVGLLAHELTHVAQQGGGAAAAEPNVQRLPDVIARELHDYVRYVPGYTLFTVVIGWDPLLGERVDRTATNLVGGLLGLIPFGTLIFDKLNEYGILEAAFAWLGQELRRLDLSLDRIERTIQAAWDDIHLVDGIDDNIAVLRRHFGALYNDVVAFAGSVVDHVVGLIREAVVGVAEALLADNRAWALFKKVIHYDPLRGVEVAAPTEEILADFLVLIGKQQELEQMRARGSLAETAAWLDTQLGRFMALLGGLRAIFAAAWDAIQPANLAALPTNLRSLVGQVGAFIADVWSFAATVAVKVLELIKRALLDWLSSFAHEVPGFHLLTVILGRNPLTGAAVPRSAENIIRGFITLLPNGEQTFAKLQESGTIATAAARIEGAIEELGISWDFVVGLFVGLWNAVTIEDLIDPIGTFTRIRNRFGEPIGRLFAFVSVVLREVIGLVLELMNFPTELVSSIIANAMQAIDDIRRDPVAFLLNMLAAVKQGFARFFDNILPHLVGGLSDWLFRGLRQAGIEPPRDLSLQSVLGFVLQVLGLSIERIWQKLGERLGRERVDRVRRMIDRLTGIWTFVRDVQERGVAAIWQHIESQISNLWSMLLDKARDWVMERIVNRAITWLLGLLDPTGIMPVINSFMAFFRAVQSAIDYLRDILAIVNEYVTTIASVARGAIEPGAQKLEQALGHAVPIVIGFLANQFGFGNIGEKIGEIVGGIRALVDRALDWLLDRAVSIGQSILNSLGLGGAQPAAGAEPPGTVVVVKNFEMKGTPHALTARVTPGGAVTITMASLAPQPLVQAIARAIERVTAMGSAAPAGLRGQLQTALQQASQNRDEMEQNWKAQDSRANVMRPGERTLAFETFVERELTFLIMQLVVLANEHNLHDLTSYFADVPEQRYLPPGYDVRGRLYQGPGSNWGAVQVDVMRDGKNNIRRQVIEAQRTRDYAAFNALKRDGKFIPERADFTTFDPNTVIDGTIAYHVDHKVSLAQHWQRQTGNDVGDGVRWSHAIATTNLQVVTEVYNLRKSSTVADSDEMARYLPRWVGLSFKSQLAESSRDKAKTIEGQPFLHSEGGLPVQ